MQCNVGKTEGIARVITGLGLITYGIMRKSYMASIIGISPLVTGIIGYCPLSSLFGINTCNNQQDNLIHAVTGADNISQLIPEKLKNKEMVGSAK